MQEIALSLVSHTNVGKTTLARTLLRRDVGTVFDQAHVTDVSEAWPLIETDDARLLLWDTPGFGDTVRLLKRLRNEGNPLGWFLHAVWDKVADRPLWCSQEAVRNIREDADVVVYLVNAAEDPQDAAYVPLELELLGWLECPVLLLLNQTGPASDVAALERRWRAAVSPFPHVRGVLSLDAFTRCWVQEATLIERAGELLAGSLRDAMKGLVRAWNARNLRVFDRAVDAVARLLTETAADREPLPSVLAGKGEKQRAMTALAERLEERSRRMMEMLIDVHGLDGEAATEVKERIEDFELPGGAPFDVRGGAFWGGLLTGAATGVGAEVVAGGLGFGSGILVGGVLGALGGAGLAKGFQIVLGFGKEPAVRWGAEFLTALTRQCAWRYLAVAQFGRGRGAFRDDALAPPDGNPWLDALDVVLEQRGERLTKLWKSVVGEAAKGAPWPSAATGAARVDRPDEVESGELDGSADPPAEPGPETPAEVRAEVAGVLADVLVARYPESAALLERARG